MRVAVYSMTGYANASASAESAPAAALHEARGSAAKATPAAALSVEIRSVNGRFLDIAMRLPDELRGLEPALRALLTARFKRGSARSILFALRGMLSSVQLDNQTGGFTAEVDNVPINRHLTAKLQSIEPTITQAKP